MEKVPVIDLRNGEHEISSQIREACTTFGFFYVTGHDVPVYLQDELEQLSHRFFALPSEEKMKIKMSAGGKAWRGFFPLGDELTSGKPDQKEGIYFGEELDASDARVIAKWPMHGANLFPEQVPELKEIVLRYLEHMHRLGQRIMSAVALSLGLAPEHFSAGIMHQPLMLFRIFHYPPVQDQQPSGEWGVGEHTDYGVLTILKQDNTGGLQIRTRSRWIEAPYLKNTFICNIGDMLDRMTRGFYKSTPHRAVNRTAQSRLSFPFFFDPAFDAQIAPLDIAGIDHFDAGTSDRWDDTNIYALSGTYGEYILDKVARVFPQLLSDIEQSEG